MARLAKQKSLISQPLSYCALYAPVIAALAGQWEGWAKSLWRSSCVGHRPYFLAREGVLRGEYKKRAYIAVSPYFCVGKMWGIRNSVSKAFINPT